MVDGITFLKVGWTGAQDSAEALSVRLFDELTNKMHDLQDGKEARDGETKNEPTSQ